MTLNSQFIRLVDRYVGWVMCGVVWILNLCLRRRATPTFVDVDWAPRRILLIKFPGLGNVVMMLPSINAVREQYPQAHITFFTLWRNRQMLDDTPLVDEQLYLVVHDGFRFLWSVACAVFHLVRYPYDLVLDFEQFAKASAFFTAVSNAPVRVGFETMGQHRGFVYTHRVPYTDREHMVETFAEIPKAVGISVDNLDPIPLPVSQVETDVVRRVLQVYGVSEHRLLIGVHPGTGGNFPDRQWPIERFAEVADYLMSHYRAEVFITGSHGERALVERMIRHMQHSPINLCARLNVRETAALLQRCDLFFCNDTGPLHLAWTMGTSVVGIYGPNTPMLYGPRGEGHTSFYHRPLCSPCITNFNQKNASCRDPVCVRSVSVEEVLRVVEAKYFTAVAQDHRIMQPPTTVEYRELNVYSRDRRALRFRRGLPRPNGVHRKWAAQHHSLDRVPDDRLDGRPTPDEAHCVAPKEVV